MSPELLAIVYGLTSAVTWGTGDFAGGVAAKRTNVFVVVLIAHLLGTVSLFLLALLLSEPFPGWPDMVIGAGAGILGSIGLVSFYQALASNKMGLVAAVAAAVSAAFPVIIGTVLEGAPGGLTLLGFGLAIVAVTVISASGGVGGLALKDLGLPVLAGLGFAGFFVLIDQANTISVYWPLVSARVASVLSLALVIWLTTSWEWPARASFVPILLAGVFDTAGNLFFTLAAAVGRLDIAAVLASLYPATTVLLAWIILKERLTIAQWLGVVLALLAVILIAT